MLQQNYSQPPDCCVVIEMENGVSLGVRKAQLLREIDEQHSVSQAAKTIRLNLSHARDIVREMNSDFCAPLVRFPESASTDLAELTKHGRKIVESYWRQFEPIWSGIINERMQHY